LIADDFTELPVTLKHTEEFLRIPKLHGDPFDRILVAQARVEGATIVTHDRALAPYGVPIIWT
jgi:PIN domain nuclease of toxin-antitoxin system